VKSYTTGAVTSKDGTTIGYRQMGQGPALILAHGGLQASQNFMKLATALSDEFTVYVPDRRGRGLSGPLTSDFNIQKAVDDMQAIIDKTGAHNVFGLSSGAIILLQSALRLPEIHKLALFEPPLSINGSSPTDWLAHYDREVADGDLPAAMVSVMKGTRDTSLFAALPRFVSVPILRFGMKDNQQEVKEGDVPLATLIPTVHYDVQLVIETANTIEMYRDVQADVLLLGGSKSAAYLKFALDQLEAVLPHVKRVEFPGFDHLASDNDGQPERVAEELRRFFRESPA
jgi:pimeloyl-ACP methyl ester carboxylesterase